MSRIAFGTSGWRSIIGEDFTFENVKLVSQAIADHLKEAGLSGKGIIVGYDTRFMGERFAKESARVLTGAGVKTFLCSRDVPTPVISFEILRRQAGGAINFTASHNPPEYNGMKFSPAWGGPALPETTRDIERRVNEMMGEFCYSERFLDDALRGGMLEEIDPRNDYLAALEKLVDFDSIASLGHVAVNPLYGTARGYLDTPLRNHLKVTSINDHLDPYFGGFPPEPSAKHIPDFISLVKGDASIRLGLATDGDADRFGIVDVDGTYIEPNYVIALLLNYLVTVRKLEGGVARSVATSHFIDAVALKHDIPVYETPVGFKFIGELISQDKIIIGGEESAGLSIKGHVPEKDGIIACLLVAEMVARQGKSVRELLEDLYAEVGRFVTARRNLTLTPELEESFSQKMGSLPSTFAGSRVRDIVTMDGTKIILEDGSWLLFRKSGTEPVVRLYAEASSDNWLATLVKVGSDFILS